MDYIGVPLAYEPEDSTLLDRPLKNRVAMIDNFIDMLVFTPRGTFAADPDFGFEYWDHEYANVVLRDFNNGQSTLTNSNIGSDVTRLECQKSIKDGLEMYEPSLKDVDVAIELNASDEKLHRRRMTSKYRVDIIVTGMLEGDMGNRIPYRRVVSFLVEPTAKRVNI